MSIDPPYTFPLKLISRDKIKNFVMLSDGYRRK